METDNDLNKQHSEFDRKKNINIWKQFLLGSIYYVVSLYSEDVK